MMLDKSSRKMVVWDKKNGTEGVCLFLTFRNDEVYYILSEKAIIHRSKYGLAKDYRNFEHLGLDS